ncbi:MAG: dihydroorotase family protein [Planctomycetota bacterium]|nr:dihydroorotase family protein [Planctomycetota bacterium]
MPNLLVRNVILASDTSQTPCDILIEDRRIRNIQPAGQIKTENSEVLDCPDLVALTSPLDNHVHFREPGPSAYKEGWRSGSEAALTGGVTGVIEVQNSTPYLDNMDALRAKRTLVERESCVDFGFYATVTADNLDSLSALHPHVFGYKVFMGASTGNLAVKDPGMLRAVGELCNDTGIPMIVHAERRRPFLRNTPSCSPHPRTTISFARPKPR